MTTSARGIRMVIAILALSFLAIGVRAGTYPALDLDPKEALAISIEGIKGVSPSLLTLTDEDLAKLKAGNFTAAFSYHILSDQCSQTKLAAAREKLDELGIKTVSVTDANFKAETQMSDIESAMALNPDVIFVKPIDADTIAAALERVIDSKTHIIFMESVGRGFKPGVDYAACVNSDTYGNGKAAADIMARELGYKGKVAMLYYDANDFTTNERDRGFRETIANSYPDIEIVMEAGFADQNNTGTVADAIFARFPDIDGIYGSWDIPAEGAIASALSLGRDDVIITCCDLGDNAARMIAEGGIIRGTGAPRSYEQGQAEALAAAYALLGKPFPSTYITPPALPVVKENVLSAYKLTYNAEPPQFIVDAAKVGSAK
ncbi:MAG: substrate-binding domain-containing protein [Planctomycetes bacterium]|nr:substrate-binding domain-containing protein [Planctomycetota bacterium]